MTSGADVATDAGAWRDIAALDVGAALGAPAPVALEATAEESSTVAAGGDSAVVAAAAGTEVVAQGAAPVDRLITDAELPAPASDLLGGLGGAGADGDAAVGEAALAEDGELDAAGIAPSQFLAAGGMGIKLVTLGTVGLAAGGVAAGVAAATSAADQNDPPASGFVPAAAARR